MAKFTRFDPRNKKNGRNKNRSIDRDHRIHDERKSKDKFKLKGPHAANFNMVNEDEEDSYQDA